MTKERILEITLKLKELYDFMEKVDAEVRTCAYGVGYEPTWHIYDAENFWEICKTLEMEPELERDTYTIVVNTVRIFYFDAELAAKNLEEDDYE